MSVNYCSQCGSDQLKFSVPQGDHLKRFICSNCNTIHYTNPNMVVGCLVENEGKILMARRGIEPGKGYWNLPCGFLENNESVEEGAQREVFEETGARVDLLFPHCVYNLTKAQQVYFIFLARMNAPEYHLTEESTEISFFDENDMPWDEIAFTSNTYALKKYFGKEEKEREQLFLASYPDIA